MSETIKNLIETIEKESSSSSVITCRIKSIPKFHNLGPFDLCFLTKEFQKSIKISFKKNIKTNFFHEFIGVDLPSPASISAYLKKLLELQEKEKSWLSNGKWRITNGYFCIYDAFTKIDIHVDIAIPGGMKLYGYAKDGNLINIDDQIWERAYISSVLRTMSHQKDSHIKLYRIFNKKNDLTVFLDILLKFFIMNPKICNELTSPHVTLIESNGNRVLNIVVDWLLRKRRYVHLSSFLQKLQEHHKKYASFYSLFLEKKGKPLDALTSLANILLRTPHDVVLLYRQSNLLFNLQRFDEALILSRILVDLCSDSFEAWYLLSKIYLKKKNYVSCLIALNIAPVNKNLNQESIEYYPKLNQEFTSPEEKHDSSLFEFNFMVTDSKLKFARYNEEMFMLAQDFHEENEKLQNNLENLSANKLSPLELKLYSILIQMEQEITWEKLLKLRGNIFLMENDNSSLNLPKSDHNNQEYEIFEEKNDHENKERTQDEKYDQPTDLKKQNSEKSYSSSEHELELPSFLQPEEEYDEQLRKLKSHMQVINQESNKKISNWNDKRTQKITELSIETFETEKNLENEEKIGTTPQPQLNEIMEVGNHNEECKSESSLHEKEERQGNLKVQKKNKDGAGKNKKSSSPHPMRPLTPKNEDPTPKNQNSDRADIFKVEEMQVTKRLCSKTTDFLFLCLFEDLNCLYDWQAEENLFEKEGEKKEKDPEQEDDSYEDKISGSVWVLRGILSDRLVLENNAEKAYKKAIETGFNLFAWIRLFQIYLNLANYKSCQICIAEIMDEFEREGAKTWGFIPTWLEEGVLEISEKGGWEGKEEGMIEEVAQEWKYWNEN